MGIFLVDTSSHDDRPPVFSVYIPFLYRSSTYILTTYMVLPAPQPLHHSAIITSQNLTSSRLYDPMLLVGASGGGKPLVVHALRFCMFCAK